MNDNSIDISVITKSMLNYELFCKEILGIKRNDEFGWKDMAIENVALCKFLQHEKKLSKLVLTPRYSLKSTIIDGYILWKIVRNPNIRILIYSDTSTKAQGFLQGIKNHITGQAANTQFKKYFDGYESSVKWTESEIVVGKRTAQYIEPTVDTGGIETTKVGRHYDLLVFDDIVSDINTTTKAQMDKTYDCYKKSLSLLKPGGEVIIVGTRWNFGDAYGRIINEDKDFGLFIRKAEIDGTYPYEDIGLNKEFLDKQKNAQGSYFYSCLYLNNPVSDDEAIFRYDKFTFYGSINHEDLYITATIDPAGEGEDYTAITVVGTDKNYNIYILDVVNEKLKPNMIVHKIVQLSYKWRFTKLGIEVNFFESLERDIKMAMEEERTNNLFSPFSIETYRATSKLGSSKFNRIQSLQPYHERGSLRFPGTSVEKLTKGFSDLAFQMIQYTPSHRPTNDDALDALAYQIKLIRPSDKVVVETLSPNSFKSVYLRNRQKQMELQRRLPSKLRKFTVDPLFG